jgi:hypothetical protein
VQAIGQRCVLSAVPQSTLGTKNGVFGEKTRRSLVTTKKLRRHVLRPSSGYIQILHEALYLKP